MRQAGRHRSECAKACFQNLTMYCNLDPFRKMAPTPTAPLLWSTPTMPRVRKSCTAAIFHWCMLGAAGLSLNSNALQRAQRATSESCCKNCLEAYQDHSFQQLSLGRQACPGLPPPPPPKSKISREESNVHIHAQSRDDTPLLKHENLSTLFQPCKPDVAQDFLGVRNPAGRGRLGGGRGAPEGLACPSL